MRSEACESTLEKVCELIAGFAFKSIDFGNYTQKVIKIADIVPPYIYLKSMTGVNEAKYNTSKISKYIARKGDFMLAMTGATIGKIGRLVDGQAYVNQRVLLFKPNEKLVDKRYIYYTLIRKEFADYIYNHIDSETAQPNISASSIGKYPIRIHSLAIQRSIAATLSSLDDKIELNNRIIANLEAQAQAIFKSWFVDFEPFQDGEFVESELGLIPKGWRVGTLDELIDIRYGKDHKKLSDGNIPVYGSGGIMRFADEAIYIGESVLIPRKGTLSNVLYVTGQFWTVDTMFYTIMRKNNIAKFMYLFVLGLDLSSMNSGSAVPSMTTNILNAIQLVIPKDEDFERFETAVSPMYKAMKLLEKQNERLAQVRDTLLPKLMSGEIEVPVEG